MLITTTELCKKIGVSRTTINNWRKEGMPFKKFGKLVRLEEEEVMKWLNERK